MLALVCTMYMYAGMLVSLSVAVSLFAGAHAWKPCSPSASEILPTSIILLQHWEWATEAVVNVMVIELVYLRVIYSN